MTGYAEILNTQIDVDSPITTGLMVQLRDNPIAITEGAVGAPRNQTASIQDLAITEPKLADNAVTASKLATDIPVARAWLKTTGSTINDSFNVASVSFSAPAGSSTLTVNLTTAMASVNYAVVATGHGSTTPGKDTKCNIVSASSFQIISTATLFDGPDAFDNFSVVVFGDQ